MVSASKMKKSQATALKARPYTEAALHLLDKVSESAVFEKHSLLEKREVKNVCLFVVTSDKGLCGSLNSNVLRNAQQIIDEHPDKNISIVAVGKKAAAYFKRRDITVTAVFDGIGDSVGLEEIFPMTRILIDDFNNKKFDKVVAIYTNFISTLRQEVEVKKILPLTEKSIEKTIQEIGGMDRKKEKIEKDNTEYLFEPSPEEVLCHLLPSLVETQIYHIILEANASEHSARMVTMKNATDNAKKMLEELTLTYNYARQQKITQEMSEITTGVMAQEKQ